MMQSMIGHVSSDTKSNEGASATRKIKQEREIIVLDDEQDEENSQTNQSDGDCCVLNEENKKQLNRVDDEIIILDDDQDAQLTDYDQLIGECYSIPFVLNGRIEMHEAEIIRIVEIDEDGDAKLEVKFLYPLNESMKHCSRCERRNDCPFNHGHLVDLSMIKDAPNTEDLKLNSNCLYNEENGEYWSKGKLVDRRKSDLCTVRSESTQQLITLQLANIRLFDNDEDNGNEVVDEQIESMPDDYR